MYLMLSSIYLNNKDKWTEEKINFMKLKMADIKF